MATARRITSNFLSLAAAEIISKTMQLIIFIYLARVYGKSEFGVFGFALAFSTIIVIIADFGINTLLIREISRKICFKCLNYKIIPSCLHTYHIFYFSSFF